MKPWLRLTLVTMTVGGGFAGVAGTLQSLFNSPGASALNLMLILVFLGLYVFVIISGLLFVHDPTRTGLLLAALAIQIPSISSSLVVYKFAAGLEAFINVGGLGKDSTTGAHLDWNLLLGSSWRFAFQQSNSRALGSMLQP